MRLQSIGCRVISFAPFVSDDKAVGGGRADNLNDVTVGSKIQKRRTFKVMTGFGLLGAGGAMLVLGLVGGFQPQAMLIAGVTTGGAGAVWMLCLFVRNQFCKTGKGVLNIKREGKSNFNIKIGSKLKASALTGCCKKPKGKFFGASDGSTDNAPPRRRGFSGIDSGLNDSSSD